jgi:hypothetical protein
MLPVQPARALSPFCLRAILPQKNPDITLQEMIARLSQSIYHCGCDRYGFSGAAVASVARR